MDKIRWGVLGAGGIADRRAMPGLLRCPSAELVALMGPNPQNTERLREKYGAKRAYSDDEALLRDPEIDAVYIASPVAFHARQAMLAADRGKHILIEKPLALTADEGQAVVNYCEEKGVRIAAGFMMRFGSYVQEMRRQVAEGKIGQVVSAYAQFTCWYPDMPGVWRQSKASGGGGALMDMGVHVIDLIQFITGSAVRQVASLCDTQTFRYDVEDSSSVLLQLENGAQAALQVNFNIPDEAAQWRLEFFGTRGHLMGDSVIGQTDGGHLDALSLPESNGYDAIQAGAARKGETITAQFGDLYEREFDSFCQTLLHGAPFAVPASDAVRVQRVVEAAYRSSLEKRFVQP